ncbi:MAG: hypothetical protein WCC81_12910, partial [Pseudolabrys sp.]
AQGYGGTVMLFGGRSSAALIRNHELGEQAGLTMLPPLGTPFRTTHTFMGCHSLLLHVRSRIPCNSLPPIITFKLPYRCPCWPWRTCNSSTA